MTNEELQYMYTELRAAFNAMRKAVYEVEAARKNCRLHNWSEASKKTLAAKEIRLKTILNNTGDIAVQTEL